MNENHFLVNNSLIMNLFPEDNESDLSMNSSMLKESSKANQKFIEQCKKENNKLESIIVALKQTKIPIVIAIENTKEDLHEIKEDIKVKNIFSFFHLT